MSEQTMARTSRNGDERGERDKDPGTAVVRAPAEERPPVAWRAPAADESPHRVMTPLVLRPITPAHQPEIHERPISRMNPFYLPRARAHMRYVVATPRSGAQPVNLRGRRFTGSEVLWSGGTLYEVDLGLHHTSVQFDLPAAGDTSAFRTTAYIEWRVNVAERVVQDNLHDIREALSPVLHERLGPISRQFEVDDIARAENALAAELKREDPGEVYGLYTKIVLRLTADEKGSEYAATRRELEQKIEIEDLRQEHRRKQQKNEEELLRIRLELYRAIIASGNVDHFALQLARNPDDVRAVVQLLNQERDEERARIADFVKHLLDSGAVDRWDVDDQVRVALEWLAQATRRAIRITDDTTAGPNEDRVSRGPT
jgi:hypothetical protein